MEIIKFIMPIIMILTSCSTAGSGIPYTYGVFLGLDGKDISAAEEYRTVVIDAQYFSADDIAELKQNGHMVLSYINLGALENFRPYYKEYESCTLDVYENWEEEKWVDVAAPRWKDFMSELSVKLLDKGCDGLFVDNADVYYHYHTDSVFDGITDILRSFKKAGAYVSVNGGDVYVSEYADRYGCLDVIDAVNQETVFSEIDFDSGTFSSNSAKEREYFTEYINRVNSFGKDVFLLEYTTDKKLIAEIDSFCREKGYTYYCSQTLELLRPSPYGSQKV